MNRRDFLREAALIGAAPFLGTNEVWAGVQAAPSVRLTGEDNKACHALRDGLLITPETPTEEAEVVIIGGGVSGLTAAWHLQDRVILVLEKNPTPGGNCRGETWKGIRYAQGSAYLSEPDERLAAFYKTIGLKLKEAPSPTSALHAKGKMILDHWGEGIADLPYPKWVIRSFKQARKDFKDLAKDPRAPTKIPVAKNHPEAFRYEKITFADYLGRYAPEVTEVLDLFTRSCWGVPTTRISAFAGINFMASEFSPIFVFPGGNEAVAEQLARPIRNSLRLRAFALRITQDENGVLVTYVSQRKVRSIRAKAAIIATPKHVALRMLPDLPKSWRASFSRMRYGAFLVCQVMSREVLYDQSYSLNCLAPPFVNISVADWTQKKPRKEQARPAVLTLDLPMGEAEGRRILLSNNITPLHKKTAAGLEKLFPGCTAAIEGYLYYRWGHPMVITAPNFWSRNGKALQRPWGRVSLAHSDAEGLPCMEAAIAAGKRAAEQVLRHLRKS
ncbi:MAG: FAD-dependent oxidoreductase [Armatimonadetes bacterium]|nr:FAD-dependent oxidoreductase [Armatimonadota bacterium]